MNKLKGYLGSLGMTSSSTASSSAPAAGKLDELGCDDALDAAQFSLLKTSTFGFPAEPSCLAYDPVQRILAIGTKNGRVRIFGQPGADCCLVHPIYDQQGNPNATSSTENNINNQAPNQSSPHQPQPMPAAVVQIIFNVNEGGLITLCSDYKLHYWNLKDTQPSIKNSIQFQREMFVLTSKRMFFFVIFI